MKRKLFTGILLASLFLRMMLPAALAETRESVIMLEGMEEPITETLFVSPAGFSFWYADEQLAAKPEPTLDDYTVVTPLYSDDRMVLRMITEEEARLYAAVIHMDLPDPADSVSRRHETISLEEPGGPIFFFSLLAQGGHYLLAVGHYARDAAEGNAKYFQRVLDSVTFTAGE